MWGSAQSTDYDRIIDRFDLTSMEGVQLDSPSKLHRRGIVFAHRDVDQILEAQRTGASLRCPHGFDAEWTNAPWPFHVVVEQARWFQEQGGDVTIAVADLESQATRGVSWQRGAPWLSRSTFRIMQPWASIQRRPTSTSNPRPVVQRLGFQLGKRTNLSEFEAIYGFGGETNLAHVQAPLVQVGDILHPINRRIRRPPTHRCARRR